MGLGHEHVASLPERFEVVLTAWQWSERTTRWTRLRPFSSVRVVGRLPAVHDLPWSSDDTQTHDLWWSCDATLTPFVGRELLRPSWEADSDSANQEIPVFYGTRRFIPPNVFTRARHRTISWTTRINTLRPHFFKIRFNIFLPSTPRSSQRSPKLMYALLVSMSATCTAHFVLDLTALIILGEDTIDGAPHMQFSPISCHFNTLWFGCVNMLTTPLLWIYVFVKQLIQVIRDNSLQCWIWIISETILSAYSFTQTLVC
jgi:hypothetical protein